MLGARHERAQLQSDFYRDQYRKMLRWLIGSMAICYILIVAIFFLVLVQPGKSYYGNTPDGRILPMPMATQG